MSSCGLFLLANSDWNEAVTGQIRSQAKSVFTKVKGPPSTDKHRVPRTIFIIYENPIKSEIHPIIDNYDKQCEFP